MRQYSIEEKISCIARELAFREKVYTKNVEAGEMKKEDAEHQIGCMKAILMDYKDQQPNLFNPEAKS